MRNYKDADRIPFREPFSSQTIISKGEIYLPLQPFSGRLAMHYILSMFPFIDISFRLLMHSEQVFELKPFANNRDSCISQESNKQPTNKQIKNHAKLQLDIFT